jgi:hypothetical protein
MRTQHQLFMAGEPCHIESLISLYLILSGHKHLLMAGQVCHR